MQSTIFLSIIQRWAGRRLLGLLPAGWQEIFRSCASPLAGDQKVCYQLAGRRYFHFKFTNSFTSKQQLCTVPQIMFYIMSWIVIFCQSSDEAQEFLISRWEWICGLTKRGLVFSLSISVLRASFHDSAYVYSRMCTKTPERTSCHSE